MTRKTRGEGMKRCLECGTKHSRTRQFCTDTCRKTWNNRRMTRGAVIHDLAMRARAHKTRAHTTLLNQQLDAYLAQDTREGRDYTLGRVDTQEGR